MNKILTIEDDQVTAAEIAAELSLHGFTCEIVSDGRLGLEKALSGGYDAITLDRMLPGIDGLNIVVALRAARINTPVLMISALSDVDERVRGLRAGGDDYLTKPFASNEMTARLEVLIRRCQVSGNEQKLQVADLCLDLIERRCYRSEIAVELQGTEFRLLEFMMRNSGQTLTRGMIFEAVWNYHFDSNTNVIDVHIARLRKKVDFLGVPPLIHTVRGVGYSLGVAA